MVPYSIQTGGNVGHSVTGKQVVLLMHDIYPNLIRVYLTELHLIGGGDIDNVSGLAYQAVPAWHKLS